MKKYTLLWFAVLLLGIYIFLANMTPSLDKNWETDQKILTEVNIYEESIFLKNIRNFRYSDVDNYEIDYYDWEYELSEVESVDYIIEPFGDIDGFAHTMLSFGFSDGRYLSISAEIRKEVWEAFHPVSGLFNKYEIVYIIGDEEDLIKLRANYRKDTVILYPIKAEKEKIKQLFLSVMQRADTLSKEPEFYNSFTNTCTTSILSHVNLLRKENNKSPIEWWKKILLPSRSDEIAYNLWLINTELSLEQAREYYTINTLSWEHKPWGDYSKTIRKEIK